MSAIITVNGSLLGSKFRNDVTESRGVRSHPFIAHSDHRGAREPVDFPVSKLSFLPCGESPVFTVAESQYRASVVPLSRADNENGETMVVTVA